MLHYRAVDKFLDLGVLTTVATGETIGGSGGIATLPKGKSEVFACLRCILRQLVESV